jgi:aryl-alcohol dehydrogenase-like predicted oxidoreductase
MTVTIERLSAVRLGEIGPVVGTQGLGTTATGYCGAQNDAEAFARLGRALDLGVPLFDTANSYGDGKNEEFISPFVRANRDRVVIAAKFGIVRKDGAAMNHGHNHRRSSGQPASEA